MTPIAYNFETGKWIYESPLTRAQRKELRRRAKISRLRRELGLI